VIALALRAVKNLNTCITQEKETINDLDKKLAIFERNVSSTETKAEQNLNVNSLVESEFDKMRGALYQAIDSGDIGKVKSVANQQCHNLEINLRRQIEEHCKKTTEWFLNELRRLKRNLNSSTNTNHFNVSFNNITVGIDASSITKEMQDFDFGNAVKVAMSAAGIAMLFPGVGWVLGGIIAIIGGIFGGVFGKDGRAEAKQKVDSSINEVSRKMIYELNNGVLRDLKNHYKKVSKELVIKIKKERSNIQNLKEDIEALKEEMKTTINIIRQYE
ncbi:MAG: hypothetical protein HUJ63_12840, partial [Enterococcus sp.]|nr:hypothetical protein [Enterococcus sp.]